MTTSKNLMNTVSSAASFGHWIEGQACPSMSGNVFERENPFDRSVAGLFANGDEIDAQAAIDAARKAFDTGSWPKSSARTRYQVLIRIAQIIAQNASVLSERMVLESGKPVTTALGEIQAAVKTFEFYAGLVLALEGSAISDRAPDALGLILHEPIGVSALITPWNFPLLNPVCKLAPALAAGCTIVIKPSHLCSGPTVLLAQYLAEAGLPEGVCNVVTSDIERGAIVGQIFAGSPLVDKVAFTGSTVTGRAVMRAAAGNNKRVSLELGGKSANIIFDDAPLEIAAATAIGAFCYNSGQQCSAGSRLLLQRGAHDRFIEELVSNAQRQIVGDPAEKTTNMGPIISEEQYKRVLGYVAIGRKEGDLLTGGEAPTDSNLIKGYFLKPTIFDNVSNTAQVAREEVFGPVLAVIPFDNEKEAIELANDNPYGLAGGVWTRSLDRAIRVVKGVRTGKMFVNCYNTSGLDDMPHGGYKDSGIGREFGKVGLEEYQQIKTVQIKLGQ